MKRAEEVVRCMFVVVKGVPSAIVIIIANVELKGGVVDGGCVSDMQVCQSIQVIQMATHFLHLRRLRFSTALN